MITWDQRGHGGTRAPGPFTYWDSAADVLALLDQLGVERAVLAGMSQGGFLSLRAALTAPDQVRALVLIDSQAGLEDPAVAPGYEQMHQAWLEHGPGPVQEVVASIILGPGPVGRLVRQVERAVRAVGAGRSGAADLAVPVPDGQG